MLTESVKGVSRKFKEVSRVFEKSLSEESSMGVQVRLKGISSSFKGVSRVFQKKVQHVWQGSVIGVSWKFPRSFKSGPRKF